jgi:tRNA nucleotidyltransferase (CCA-adding enzyme)
MGTSILNRLKLHPGWPDVERIILKLGKEGFQVVLAGGCVRDALIGRPINDFDIATDATPDQVESLFPRSLAVGKAFGVIKVIAGTGAYDVATFRNDGSYADGRRPRSVKFSNLEEDAKRRDFTVNALFYSLAKDEVIDTVGGIKDLERKIIRTVGRAEDRFDEDSLRALRAIRFSAQLQFEIEPETWEAVKSHAPVMPRLARERQAEELRKLAVSTGAAKGWELLREAGLLAMIFPDLDQKASAVPRVWHVALRAIAADGGWPFPVTLAWFGKCFGFEPKTAGKWLESLNASLAEQSQAVEIARGLIELRNSSLTARLKALDGMNGPWLVKLWPLSELPLDEEKARFINSTMESFRERMDDSGHLPMAFVKGDDLKNLGVEPGPRMGKLIQKAYDHQLENPGSNKQEILNWLKSEIN